MEKAHGYSQMKLNYIKGYANAIQEEAIKMDVAWGNRNNFNEKVDLDYYFENARKELDRLIKDFRGYLEPFEDED